MFGCEILTKILGIAIHKMAKSVGLEKGGRYLPFVIQRISSKELLSQKLMSLGGGNVANKKALWIVIQRISTLRKTGKLVQFDGFSTKMQWVLFPLSLP